MLAPFLNLAVHNMLLRIRRISRVLLSHRGVKQLIRLHEFLAHACTTISVPLLALSAYGIVRHEYIAGLALGCVGTYFFTSPQVVRVRRVVSSTRAPFEIPRLLYVSAIPMVSWWLVRHSYL